MNEVERMEAVRQEKNRYFREYRAKNKERIKAINDRYWARRAAREAAEKEVGNAPHENN